MQVGRVGRTGDEPQRVTSYDVQTTRAASTIVAPCSLRRESLPTAAG